MWRNWIWRSSSFELDLHTGSMKSRYCWTLTKIHSTEIQKRNYSWLETGKACSITNVIFRGSINTISCITSNGQIINLFKYILAILKKLNSKNTFEIISKDRDWRLKRSKLFSIIERFTDRTKWKGFEGVSELYSTIFLPTVQSLHLLSFISPN